MKNVYDGEAEISLPDWFGSLNKDFRYQLLLLESPDRISISQRKYPMTIQTTVTVTLTVTTTARHSKSSTSTSASYRIFP